MNEFTKKAYEVGAKQAQEDVYKHAHESGVVQALQDFGITKKANEEGVTAGDVAKGLGVGLGATAGGVAGAGSGLLFNLGQGLSLTDPGQGNAYQRMLLSGNPDTRMGRALGWAKVMGLPAGLALSGALAGGGLIAKALESEEDPSILDSLRERISPTDNTGAIAAGGVGGVLGAGAGAMSGMMGGGTLYHKILERSPNAKTRAAAALLGAMGLGTVAGGYGGYQGAKKLLS